MFGFVLWQLSSVVIAVLMIVSVALSVLCIYLLQALRRAGAAQDELTAANKDMEAATRVKGKFLVSMRQEIQTPLNVLASFTELLAQRNPPGSSPEFRDETEGIIDIIKKCNNDILSIIDDVFDYIRIDANLLEMESVPMSIKQVLHDLCHAEKSNVVAKHLDLSVQYSDSVPETILSDPARVRQILQHIIRNAINYTEKGTITVLCEALNREDSVSITSPKESRRRSRESFVASLLQLKISITDTGVGIPPSEIPELFKPFRRGEESIMHPNHGMGLGLNIAMRLATLLDGTITVESELGKGSTFSLLLNVYVPEGAPPELTERKDKDKETHRADSRLHAGIDIRIPQHDAESTPEEGRPLRNLRVLVVEDMAVNQAIIATLLRDAGAKVELADNGAEAVEKVMGDIDSGLFFDVILMDMLMPVMDGFEATAFLRKNDYRRPIIAVTARSQAGDREKTLAAGCNDYIVKPVDNRALLDVIIKHTEGAR